MDMLNKKWLEDNYKGVVKAEKPNTECYRPIGAKQITSGAYIKCGLFYAGSQNGEFRVWLSGPCRSKGKMIKGQAVFAWYKNKEWQGSVVCDYRIDHKGTARLNCHER